MIQILRDRETDRETEKGEGGAGGCWGGGGGATDVCVFYQ